MADSAYQYIDSTGVIVPDTSTTLLTVQGEFRAVFGADMPVTPDTPQGVLITGETVARDAVIRNNAAVANQINPNLAGGVFLDALCALTGLKRAAATRSVVTANLTGQPGTIIPEGVQARTGEGDLFESLATVVLNGSGSASVEFRAIEYGPVAAAIGALNQIVSGVLGWETITNPAAATLGQDEQSDASLRQLRADTLALQGVALPEAITSAVYNVSGVRSLAFLENVANTTQSIEGISLVAHSIFVCVDGGSDEEVAEAILANKSLGCNFNGNTTVQVVEPVTGQEYDVTFERPEEIDVLVRVTVSLEGTLIDPNTAIPAAVVAYADGEIPGEKGFVVGGDVSPFELGSAVNTAYPTVYVKKVEVAVDDMSPVYSTDDIPIAKDQVARTQTSAITVIVV